MINIARMCTRCLEMLGEEEALMALKIEDDFGNVIVIKGHERCVEDAEVILTQTYKNLERGE